MNRSTSGCSTVWFEAAGPGRHSRALGSSGATRIPPVARAPGRRQSTTVGVICGLTAADAGSVHVSGLLLQGDGAACKRRIGLVPQELALFEDLSALANVELFGALYGLSRAPLKTRAVEVLAMVGLADRAKDKPSTFSGGMKRRLNIACALVHDPELIVLDEPMAGVDPQSRNAIFDNLEALKRAGKALVYTTHYMEEAERLADRVVIIDHGRVVADGTLPELVRRLPAAHSLQVDVEGGDAAVTPGVLQTLQALPGVHAVQQTGERLTVALDDLTRDAPAVLKAVATAGLCVRHFSSGRANLEDVFMALTGRQLRD